MSLIKELEELDGIFNDYASRLRNHEDLNADPKRKAGIERKIQNTDIILTYAYNDLTHDSVAVARAGVENFVGYANETGISEMRKGNKQIAQGIAKRNEQAAQTDELTKLHNRAVFTPQIKAAIKDVADREALPPTEEQIDEHTYFALVMFDLDRFKGLNDDYGHRAGDAGLQAFSGALTNITRHDRDELFNSFGRGGLHGGDKSLTRLGGDEFTLLMNVKAKSQEEAQEKFNIGFERIKENLRVLSFEHDGMTFPLVSSMGMHVLEAGDTVEEALEKADFHLLDHKASKKERYAETVEALQESGAENLQIVRDKRGELTPDDIVKAIFNLQEAGAIQISVRSNGEDMANAIETLEKAGVDITHDVDFVEVPFDNEPGLN